MGKIKLKSSYKNAARKQPKDDTKAEESAKKIVEDVSDLDDDEPSKETSGKQKSGLVKKVRFKMTKRVQTIGSEKEPNSKKRKPITISAQKAKLEEIKKQLSSNVSKAAPESGTNPLYTLVPQARLTNALLKTALTKSESNPNVSKEQFSSILAKANLSKKDLLTGVKKLDKKSKSKIKKQFWQERIDSIKNQLKVNTDKARREKTVIVGDMKPIIESLGVKVSEAPSAARSSLSEVSSLSNGTSKREQHQKNMEREKGKSVPKQSIRQKQSKEDMQLFGQLQGYSEFTSDPLSILKRHFSSNSSK